MSKWTNLLIVISPVIRSTAENSFPFLVRDNIIKYG